MGEKKREFDIERVIEREKQSMRKRKRERAGGGKKRLKHTRTHRQRE